MPRLAICAMLVLLAACSGPTPFRTQSVPDPRESCAPNEDGVVAAGCAALIHERATSCVAGGGKVHGVGYDLFFSEFDDQGALYPPGSPYGDASRQLEEFVAFLRARLAERRGNVSLVAYVHGWKHDAESADQNVRRFRSLLCEIGKIEERNGRAVVGLFIAWDAKHFQLDSDNKLLNFTFWDRKNTADKVAGNRVRELFARIRAIEADANHAWQQQVRETILGKRGQPVEGRARVLKPPMRFLLIGHSFGGRIVYEALSNVLTRDIVDLQQADEALCQLSPQEPGCLRMRRSAPIPEEKRAEVIAAGLVREADLILLVNPALEATRFQALVDAAHGLGYGEGGFPYAHYRAPLLVAIASEGDYAVRFSFPLGRYVSTLFERYLGNEAEADRTGVGHYTPQVTQRVRPLKQRCPNAPAWQEPAECKGWTDSPLKAEQRLFDAFKTKLCGGDATCSAPDGGKAYPRFFCGTSTMVMTPVSDAGCTPVKGFNPNNPVWVIRADPAIIRDHGDLESEELHALVRQLYRGDSMDLQQIARAAGRR